MCYICEREAAEAAAEAALRAAEPKRSLLVSEVLRGGPCYAYEQKLDRFAEGTIGVTVRLAVEQADDWDWYWAASRLLTAAGYEQFSERVNSADTDGYNVLAPYRKLLNDVDFAAAAAYNSTRGRVLDETDDLGQAYAAANRVYDELMEVPRAALKAAADIVSKRSAVIMATAFAEIYISEEGTEDKTGNDRWYAGDRDVDY